MMIRPEYNVQANQISALRADRLRPVAATRHNWRRLYDLALRFLPAFTEIFACRVPPTLTLTPS